MNSFKFYNDNYPGFTSISNEFIDKYMIDANSAQIKLYLYLARGIASTSSLNIADIAEHFNYTERDIIRSLNYWANIGLIKLDYNNKDIVGVCLLSPNSSNQSSTKSSAENTNISRTAIINDSSDNVSLSEDNPNILSDSYIIKEPIVFRKPIYTIDMIEQYKSNNNFDEIVFIAENYLGKMLSASDIQSIIYILDGLNFSQDLLDYLIQYCVDKGKKRMDYIEKVAINWSELNIKTASDAKLHVANYDSRIYSVMKALGKTNTPTKKELTYINKWYNELGFTTDIILLACDRTVLATDSYRFDYANKILTNWKNSGVNYASDIANLDFEHKKTISISKSSTRHSNNKFNQFQQNDYDFNELEADILKS